MNALIVDTDSIASTAVRDRLHEIGCERTRIATTTEDALCVARDRHAELDLVVLALEPPELDGLATCRRLKALLAGVPILACSSRDDDASIATAFEAGAHDFIVKPFRLRELGLRARAALNIREERLRRAQHEQRLVSWARQLEKAKRSLESIVCVDSLTGIANRRHFATLLGAEWRRAVRDKTTLSLVMFDLDEFHAYNERYGHVGGDGCLVRVARTLAHELRRASDVLARYGGEELVAILPDTDEAGACVVAERLRMAIERLKLPHPSSSRGGVVTLSAGVASRVAGAGGTPELLVQAADAALYRAKREGRNRCRAEVIDADRVTVSHIPWPACPIAIVEPALVHRVSPFLARIREDVPEALEAVEAGDLGRVSGFLLRVKRTAATLELEHVEGLAARIDAAIHASDPAEVRGALAALDWYVHHVRVVYRRHVLKAV